MQELLKKYQDILRLNDWNIELFEIPNLSSEARTKMIFNNYKAIIEINNELKIEEKEKSLIHELMHLIYRDTWDIFEETITNEFAKDYCLRHFERSIEKSAQIIYEILHKELNPCIQ